MKHHEIRRRFIDFFVSHGHQEISSANLVANKDPTLLLINSGMAPLKPYFTGEKKPPHPRLTNIQKCLRTEDIEEVGDAHHHTFFEMMGSWSIGDYGKETAVKLAWELLTDSEGFNLDPKRLYATVFAGNDYIPPDEETATYWQNAGLPSERVLKLPASENLWVSGPTGPCGPCTEVLYDRGEEYSCGENCSPTCDCGRFYEIWNAGVFMQYNRLSKTNYDELPFLSVDTGAGLERIATILQDKKSNYESDLFAPLVEEVTAQLNRNKLDERGTRSVRIIADHLRAAFFLIADGVVPSNKQEGYILRRLIRHSITHETLLRSSPSGFYERLQEKLQHIYEDIYPEIGNPQIVGILNEERETFLQTLKRGLEILDDKLDHLEGSGQGQENVFPGQEAFDLESTYGLPLETQKEIAENYGISIDADGYQKAFKRHQEISRQGAAGKFGKTEEYAEEEIAALHTATHLLHQSLREVLGEHVQQAGQSLSPERLRFDFTFDRALTEEELDKTESLVNKKIAAALDVIAEQTTLENALDQGALALFTDKYEAVENLTLYKIGRPEQDEWFSMELCGGPHVDNTSKIGNFRIIKERSVGKGTRRIRAVVDQ